MTDHSGVGFPAMVNADADYSGRPSSARIYDALLGGNHNFEVDREAAKRLLSMIPAAGEMARANRAFLNRAVRFLLDAGVRQFLDIGSGIPTVGNVHEIAQSREPGARVVYVDIDPVAVAHAGEILRDNPLATAVQADMRFPQAILDHAEVRKLIDLDRPVGLLLVSMLHFVPDDDAFVAVDRLREALLSRFLRRGLARRLRDTRRRGGRGRGAALPAYGRVDGDRPQPRPDPALLRRRGAGAARPGLGERVAGRPAGRRRTMRHGRGGRDRP
nr:hypothetical protein GCM10020092_049660 [Actinoplanes digitatis]